MEFAVEAGPPRAMKEPCTAADFMKQISRRVFRMEGVAAQLQELWSQAPELPLAWPADFAERALGSLAGLIQGSAGPSQGLDFRERVCALTAACRCTVGLLRRRTVPQEGVAPVCAVVLKGGHPCTRHHAAPVVGGADFLVDCGGPRRRLPAGSSELGSSSSAARSMLWRGRQRRASMHPCGIW